MAASAALASSVEAIEFKVGKRKTENLRGIAKVFHSLPTASENPFSFKDAQSMRDIGRKLLLTVGMQDPDVSSIEQAIEANDAFVARLEEIAAGAARTIESD